MIFIRLKVIASLFILIFLTTTCAKSHFDLREKLARLLLDPEYYENQNKILKSGKAYGMLLKDLQEHDPFLSSSEEKFYDILKRLNQSYEDIIASARETATQNLPAESSTRKMTETSTTLATKSSRTKTTATTGIQPRMQPIISSIERLSTMIGKLMDLWGNRNL